MANDNPAKDMLAMLDETTAELGLADLKADREAVRKAAAEVGDTPEGKAQTALADSAVMLADAAVALNEAATKFKGGADNAALNSSDPGVGSIVANVLTVGLYGMLK